jgi:hypothetical protein
MNTIYKKIFFSNEINLKSLITDFKNEIQGNSKIEFTQELCYRIDSLSQTINEKFTEHNNTN